MKIEWNDYSLKGPEASCSMEDELFCVSDGQTIGLARWANLMCEYPEGGYDYDEYDFKNLGDYIDINFWVGPINRVHVSKAEYIIES